MTNEPDLTLIDLAVNLKRLSEKEQTIQGKLPIKRCERFIQSLPTDQKHGYLMVELAFRLDDYRQIRIEGTIEGQLLLVCQRCLHPYEHPVNVELSLVHYESEAAYQKASEKGALPEMADPVIIMPQLPEILDSALDGVSQELADVENMTKSQQSSAHVELVKLLEDDLLLALPHVPKHELGIEGGRECPEGAIRILEEQAQAQLERVAEEKQNPQLEQGLAAIKAQLKFDQNSDN